MFKSISMMLVIAAFMSNARAKQPDSELNLIKLTPEQRFSLQKLKMRLRLCQPRVCNKCVKIIHSAYSAPKLVSSKSELFITSLTFMMRYYASNICVKYIIFILDQNVPDNFSTRQLLRNCSQKSKWTLLNEAFSLKHIP